MLPNRYTTVSSLALAIGFLAGVSSAGAQTYPMKPVRIVVPFGAGGITDLISRQVGQELGKELGQTIVIDNRPGAGGNIAAAHAARAAPDGYTLFMGTIGTQSVNQHMYSKLPYDPQQDFAPVAMVSVTPHIVVIHPSVPAKTLKELVALAKAKPGDLNFASAGNGSSPHLGLENFQLITGTKLTHVPYKSGAEGVTAVFSGQTSLTFEAIPVVISHVKAGRLRAIAVAAPKRAQAMPEVPSADEAGVPGFTSGTWQAVLVPAGTPREIIQRLNTEINKVLKSSQIRERFALQGTEARGGTPEDLDAFIKSESAKWAKVLKAAGTKLD
jgi:tripartite-type tricarboxylate transporter receptor subunit TctC